VREAVQAVLAEAAALLTQTGAPDMFLAARVARIQTVARDLIDEVEEETAAMSVDTGRLRREVRRFEAYTSALWAVRLSVAAGPAWNCRQR
jgi:hypothetical protein